MKVPRRTLRLPPAAAAFTLLALAGCSAGVPPSPPSPVVEIPYPVPEVEHADTLAEALEEEVAEVQPDEVILPPPFGYWADSVLSTLSLEEKAGQLIMPWMLGDFAPEGSAGRRRILEMVEGMGVGGVIVSVGSPSEVAVKLNDLQGRAGLPLLVAADLETGAGFRFRGAAYLPGPIFLGGATDFPSLMAVGATGDPDLAYQMGRVTGVEARALGVHVPFAPVLDVNNNPANPIINIRSFGEDPVQVARLGAAFVRGVQDAGALATGKHFPGHGDTETDSHLDLPLIPVSRDRMAAVELPPFQAAIDEGIAGIMTAHIAVPALTGAPGVPSTLSAAVLTDLLRGEMGFQGLIFTDAMDMYAIDRRHGRGEAAVRALEAGADVILMPPDPRAAMDGIVAAVREGRVTEERLDASVRRLLEAKERMGLHLEREVPVREVAQTVGIRRHEEVAQEVANRSITLLRNEGDLLPLLGTRTAQVLSVTFRRTTDLMAGRVFNETLRGRYARLTTADVDRDTPADVYATLLRRARSSALVVVSLYVTTVSYSGSVAIPERTAEFIQSLAREGVPHVVVSFGNPYLLSEFPDVRAYLLAWSGAEVSQRAAARSLFGDIPIQGRTPTRIPPFFQVGDGLQLPARQGTRDD